MHRMRRSSLIDNLSFNSYAVQQDQQRKISEPIKIMLLGAKSVGKSRMLESYTHQKKPEYQQEEIVFNKEESTHHTEGIDFVSKVQEIGNVEYHLHIWDTADFNQFSKNRAFFESLSQGVMGFIIVYDITRKQTYDLTNVIFNVIRGDLRRQVFLVGTNLNLANKGKRAVSYETALTYAATRNITLHEIQATNYEQVEELFLQLLNKIVDRKGLPKKGGVKLNQGTNSDGFQKRYNRCC